MTTVAVVLRSGGRYGMEHVTRLLDQVEVHTSSTREFACLTDGEVRSSLIRSVPLIHDWPGWWSKMELFRPELFTGRVVYLDLDMLVVGPIEDLLEYRGPFLAVRDHFAGDPVRSSSVMAWEGDNPPELYEAMHLDAPSRWNARSDLWWNDHASALAIQDELPGLVGSYKADDLEDGPGDYAIIDFHGDPKPWDMDGWPYDFWSP